MSMIDELLQRTGIKYEDLDKPGFSGEKETFNLWLSQLESIGEKTISVSDIRGHLKSMRESVEKELIDEPEFIYKFIFKVLNRKQILLKARLKNYMVLEALLDSPEKAKEMYKRYIASMVANK